MRNNACDYQGVALSMHHECSRQPWFSHLKKKKKKGYGTAVVDREKTNKDDQRYEWLPGEEQLYKLGNFSLENRPLRRYMIN